MSFGKRRATEEKKILSLNYDSSGMAIFSSCMHQHEMTNDSQLFQKYATVSPFNAPFASSARICDLKRHQERKLNTEKKNTKMTSVLIQQSCTIKRILRIEKIRKNCRERKPLKY